MSILDEPFLGKNPEEVFISNSELKSFKDCKRKWYLGNYLGLSKKEKENTGPLKLGIRIHNALEMFYKEGIIPTEAYNQLMRVDKAEFLKTFQATDPDAVKKFDSEAELGRIMLEGYYEWLLTENADSSISVSSVEKKLTYRLENFDKRVFLQGKVDLHAIRAEDGSIAIMDHKSAVSFDVYYKTAHMSEQLMMYILLERLNQQEGDPVVDGGIYNLLKKVKRTAAAKPPFYTRLDVRFNDDTLNAFWTRTLGTVRDMMAVRDALDAGQDHRYVAYPTPTNDCTWKCPFFTACPMMDDGSNVEKYLEDYFEQANPNERYQENLSEN